MHSFQIYLKQCKKYNFDIIFNGIFYIPISNDSLIIMEQKLIFDNDFALRNLTKLRYYC